MDDVLPPPPSQAKVRMTDLGSQVLHWRISNPLAIGEPDKVLYSKVPQLT